MAGDGLQADIPSLRTGGSNFTSVGKDFESASKTLQQGLTSLEGDGTPPWGDDEIGEKFGIVYTGLRDGMYESMDHLASKLQDIGGALSKMADNQESNENFTDALMQQNHADASENTHRIASFRPTTLST